jgi:hypothetical protein
VRKCGTVRTWAWMKMTRIVPLRAFEAPPESSTETCWSVENRGDPYGHFN